MKPQKTQRKPYLLPVLLSLFALMFLMAMQASADVNVLIIGSSGDSNFAGKNSSPFPASDIRTQLDSILSGAGLGTVNVTLIDRYSNNEGYRYSLADWFHYPYPADVETTTRWPNLRGEKTKDWNYVILIGDPYTMENMPGLYAQGVATIAEEVAKGGGETVLLMPWPGTSSTSSVAHYREVVYRAGRTGGYKVAPAALAWEADNKPTDATRRAFICASSIYSTIWGQSAKASTYVYNDTLADAVHNTTTTNNSKADELLFTGSKFNFQSPFLMLGDPRRDIHFGDRGSSTEQAIAERAEAVINGNRLSYLGSKKEPHPDPTPNEIYKGTYSSNTPEDDGLGWPTERNMPIAWNHGRKFHPEVWKEYVTNPAYWQIGFGFYYQQNTFSDTVANANDTHISQIFSRDLYVANHMMGANMADGQDPSARVLPWRLLWAQIHKEYPALNPLTDSVGPHLNDLLEASIANYMYTIYSGRCPLGPKPASMSDDWWSAKVGYETAWRVGTGSSRAPGFKVMPSSASAISVSSTNTETMSVQFIFPPTSDVTVNVSSSNSAVGTVSPSQLVFTPSNYNVPQTITVASAAGLAASAYFDVVFTTSSTDSAYNNLGDSWKYAALKTGETQTITVTPFDADCAEANNAGTFLLTRSGVNPNPLTVNYTLSGTAVNGTDYSVLDAMYDTALSGTITFAAHANTSVIKIDPIDDANYEGPETVTLNLTSSANYQIGSPGSNTLTLADNDKPTVSIASNLTATQEGGTSPVLTFSRTGNTAVGPLTVYYGTSGTATMGADYSPLSGAVTIPQNQSSVSIKVPILKDGLSEIAETMVVSISNNAAYTTASSPDNSCAITINDHSSDPVLVAISATDAYASEPLKGDGTGTFVISRSRDSGTALTVKILTSNSATAGDDYLALPETVTIPAGATSTTVTLTPIDDNEAELDEIVTVSLQAGSGFMLGFASSADINLYDDESPEVFVEITDTKCIEQATPDTGSFVLRRLGNRANTLSVNVTRSGTATSGTDYAALASSYTIGANSPKSSTIYLTPIDDALVEGTEKMTFTVGAGTGYAVNAQNSVTLEIREDETADVRLSVQDSGCTEQSSPDTGVFRITRVATPSALTVSYTLSGTATNGVDYTTLSGTATIPANTATVDISVSPIQDSLLEGPETVTMTLVDGGLVYELEDARESTLVIKDDELPSITLTATDANAAEADGGTTDPGLWTFTSSFAPASDLTIKYNVPSNNGIDCESLPGTIVIPAGQTSVTLPLIPIDDELVEGIENVGISLAASSGYNINTTNGLNVKIAASDMPELTIIAADPIALESPLTTGRFAISSSKVFGGNTTIKYTISGTATSVTDYTNLNTSVTINGGNSSILLNVTPLADGIVEGAETVTATLILNGTAYAIGEPSSATVSIYDDELSMPNIAPVANIESVNVAYETPTPVTLTATDANNDPLTYSMVSAPTKGSLNGTLPNLTYTPNSGFSGSDSFTFKVNDGSLDSNTATVSITINPPNDGYTITYNANTATGGAVPVNPNSYNANTTVIVFGNTGNLVKSGYTFSGWNTAANGSGTSYNEGNTFPITGSVTLYAQWTAIPTYALTVTSGSGGGTYASGAQVSITADAPASGYRFLNWTSSGGGSFANANSSTTTFTMPGNAATATANYVLNKVPVVNAGANQTIPLTLGLALGWSHTAWTGDADSGIDSANTYTAKHCFGDNNAGSVTVNGVSFVESFATSGTGWSVSGTVLNWTGNDDASISGNSEKLAQEFIYNANPRTVTFSGLTPGQSYQANFYSAGWETGDRSQTFSATGAGIANAVINQDQYGNNNGIRISCVYTATATTQQFVITPTGTSTGTFHLYGMSNHEVITTGATATLNGTATDADGDALTTTWSLVGKNPVNAPDPTFAYPSQLSTTANFTAEGTYVLRLSAHDGYVTSTDNITITVGNPTPSYALIVTSGSGEGAYESGAQVTITANAPAPGYRFVNWTSSGGGSFANASSATTTYTMPGNEATVTANYALNTAPVVNAGPNQTVALGAGVPWTPADLVVDAWWDASDDATATVSGGEYQSLTDKSGNGRTLTAPSVARQPTRATWQGRNAIQIVNTGASGDVLATAANVIQTSDNFTIISVMESTSIGRGADGYGSGWSISLSQSSCAAVLTSGGAAGYTATGTVGKLQVGKLTQGSQVAFASNGGAFTTASAPKTSLRTSTRFEELGTSNGGSAAGYIGEVLIFRNLLSDSNRQKIEGYLAHKWGLAGNLPADHPCKNAAPLKPSTVVNLNGSATDADGDSLTTTWSVVSKDPSTAANPIFANSAQPVTTATFTEAGAYTLRLSANDGYITKTSDVTITIAPLLPAKYATWSGGTFAKPFTDTALTSNPDGDSMSNLMEFAFGTDPTLSTEGSLSIDGSSHGSPTLKKNGGTMEFYFVRRKDHGTSGSVSYTAQFSNNLSSFTNSPDTPTWVANSALDPTRYEVVKVPFPNGTKFGRVEVNVVP